MEYNIVIPFDFSGQSQNVLKTAAGLCEQMDAVIHLVHVTTLEANEEQTKKLLRELQSNTKNYAETCRIKATVAQGAVGGSVLDYAARLGNPVIFVSHTSGADNKANYTGPNAHYIITNSPFPVLVLKTGLEFKKINTVLVPVALNEENKLKLGYAMFLSKFFDNALIRMLAVVYGADDYMLNRLMLRMNHITNFFERMGVSSVGEIIRCSTDDGQLYSRIAVDYAERSEAELILLMTNEEKSKPGCGISQDADYMLSHFRNNILSVTPFVR